MRVTEGLPETETLEVSSEVCGVQVGGGRDNIITSERELTG